MSKSITFYQWCTYTKPDDDSESVLEPYSGLFETVSDAITWEGTKAQKIFSLLGNRDLKLTEKKMYFYKSGKSWKPNTLHNGAK